MKIILRSIALAIIISTLISCGGDHQHGAASNSYMNQSKFDELVERFEGNNRDEWQKPYEVIEKFGNLKGKTVIDIGAGTGYFSFKLAEKGATVIAADVDERFLKYIADKKLTLKDSLVVPRLTEFEDPLLQENEADHALIVNTYHHLDNRVEYFTKVYKGLKKGGKLMVVDFKKEKTPNGPPKRHRLSAEKAKAELSKAGFSDFSMDMDLLVDQYVIVAKKQ